MYTTSPQTPDDAEAERLAKLFAEPILEIWQGIENGVAAAMEFFLPEYRTPDPHMAAQIVRYETELRLRRALSDSRSQGQSLNWDFKARHNSGIEIGIGDWR